MVEIEDVPEEVWTSVYAKWMDALETGWGETLWTRCALCEVVDGTDCFGCPLHDLDIPFCTGHMDESTLYKDDDETEEHWENTVREFLQWLKDNTTAKTGE